MAVLVKRVVDVTATRKPGDPPPSPADPGSRAVVPPPRIFWARRVALADLPRLLAAHIRDENCPHVSLRHCAICVEAHLVDLIAHLSGEANSRPR